MEDTWHSPPNASGSNLRGGRSFRQRGAAGGRSNRQQPFHNERSNNPRPYVNDELPFAEYHGPDPRFQGRPSPVNCPTPNPPYQNINYEGRQDSRSVVQENPYQEFYQENHANSHMEQEPGSCGRGKRGKRGGVRSKKHDGYSNPRGQQDANRGRGRREQFRRQATPEPQMEEQHYPNRGGDGSYDEQGNRHYGRGRGSEFNNRGRGRGSEIEQRDHQFGNRGREEEPIDMIPDRYEEPRFASRGRGEGFGAEEHEQPRFASRGRGRGYGSEVREQQRFGNRAQGRNLEQEHFNEGQGYNEQEQLNDDRDYEDEEQFVENRSEVRNFYSDDHSHLQYPNQERGRDVEERNHQFSSSRSQASSRSFEEQDYQLQPRGNRGRGKGPKPESYSNEHFSIRGRGKGVNRAKRSRGTGRGVPRDRGGNQQRSVQRTDDQFVYEDDFESQSLPYDTNSAPLDQPQPHVPNPPQRCPLLSTPNEKGSTERVLPVPIPSVPLQPVAPEQFINHNRMFADDSYTSNFEAAPTTHSIPGLGGLVVNADKNFQKENAQSALKSAQAALDSTRDLNTVRRLLEGLDSEDDEPPTSFSSQQTPDQPPLSKNTSTPVPSFNQRRYFEPSPAPPANPSPRKPFLEEGRPSKSINRALSNLSQVNESSFASVFNILARQTQPKPAQALPALPNPSFSAERESPRDVDLRKGQLLPVSVAEDNFFSLLPEKGHLSDILATMMEQEHGSSVDGRDVPTSMTDVPGIRHLEHRRVDSIQNRTRDSDMRDARPPDTFLERVDIDQRDQQLIGRKEREAEFVGLRQRPASPFSRSRERSPLPRETLNPSPRSWEHDDDRVRSAASQRSLSPLSLREREQRSNGSAGRFGADSRQDLFRLPSIRSHSPLSPTIQQRRSRSPGFQPGGRQPSPSRRNRSISPARKRSPVQRKRSRERPSKRPRSHWSRSPERDRNVWGRQVSPTRPRNPRSRSPPVHSNRMLSRSPPLRRSVSPRPRRNERTERDEHRSRSPGRRRDATHEHHEQERQAVHQRIKMYSVQDLTPVALTPNNNKFKSPERIITENLQNYSFPPPPVPVAVEPYGMPIQPVSNSIVISRMEVRSIPVLTKSMPVKSTKVGVQGRPNLCVIDTSGTQEFVPTVTPVAEVNQEEEKKKRLQEMQERKKIRAQTQRSDYAAKQQKLMQELLQLQGQNAELTMKQMKVYGEKDVSWLAILIVENAKLQSELTKQMKTIGDVVKKLDKFLENKDQPSLLAVKNCTFFDPQNHWCQACEEFFSDMQKYLEHFQFTSHKNNAKTDKSAPDNTHPWCKTTGRADSATPESASATTKKLPLKGVQFLTPVEGTYCKLCEEFMGDVHCALRHVNSAKHHEAYLEFVTNNPEWECNWVEARQKAFKEYIVVQKSKMEQKVREEADRKKKLDEERRKNHESFVKREESQRSNVRELDDGNQATSEKDGSKHCEIRVNVRNVRNSLSEDSSSSYGKLDETKDPLQQTLEVCKSFQERKPHSVRNASSTSSRTVVKSNDKERNNPQSEVEKMLDKKRTITPL